MTTLLKNSITFLNEVSFLLVMNNDLPLENTQEYTYELKIPKERIAVLIGVKGKVKRDIESSTKTKLVIGKRFAYSVLWLLASQFRYH